ncbi:DNA methyltransferase [Paenibacillus sp. FSL R7-0273]|uniref:MGMT family protein n=1 Tax=Paenibacillus sp. FSL R7-0273 TaxID=1536772 RepID=UPI0004F7393F|nr:MGMT family protein [Paenibacillus sp. FSL R7-0273]AIQ44903.1 DNA methyltransferase [Paenibacillus sp. FSL R7-0273]OMF93245.1 DNA methyltransferase [Paenibacillus sp. FSL R7-0273]
MTPFTAKVIAVIQAIPEGRVMTYGGVARAAGSPRAARQVVRILHSMSQKHKLPWHRVINAKGRVALEDESGSVQKLYLLGEGITFEADGSVNLELFQFMPEPEQEPEDYFLPPLE